MKPNNLLIKKKWLYANLVAFILIAMPLVTVKAAEFPDDEVINANEVIDTV